MEPPENTEELIKKSILEIMGTHEESGTLVNVMLNQCDYSVQEIIPHRYSVVVKCHLKNRDAKETLSNLRENNTEIEVADCIGVFNKELHKSNYIESNAEIEIVKENGEYIVKLDEETTDKFLGGLIAYSEELLISMTDEE